ncbi:MAG: hypothetical protein U0802_05650 [Candidatus Binatia bacterium]
MLAKEDGARHGRRTRASSAGGAHGRRRRRSVPRLRHLGHRTPVWMSHGDRLEEIPKGWKVLAHSENSPIALADRSPTLRIQFHPEGGHTRRGRELLENFLLPHLQGQGRLDDGEFHRGQCARIRAQVGTAGVVCGLSGGIIRPSPPP